MRHRDANAHEPHRYIFKTTWCSGVTEVNPIQSTAICRNSDILGGTPVFSGTRAPIRILIEHLEAGDHLGGFLDSYPTVSRDQAIEVLATAKAALTGMPDEAVVAV